jgi:hypothetical protein
MLLAILATGTAFAQNPAELPPPGTMSAKMPEGVEIYMSMAISDADQQVSRNMGASASEAKIRSLKECNDKYTNCVELITFPVRNHCMGLAVNKKAKPNIRALFVNVEETGKTKPGELAQKSLDQCKAAGGAQCESQSDYCF